jgi:hypothetical protein
MFFIKRPRHEELRPDILDELILDDGLDFPSPVWEFVHDPLGFGATHRRIEHQQSPGAGHAVVTGGNTDDLRSMAGNRTRVENEFGKYEPLP